MVLFAAKYVGDRPRYWLGKAYDPAFVARFELRDDTRRHLEDGHPSWWGAVLVEAPPPGTPAREVAHRERRIAELALCGRAQKAEHIA